MTGHKMKAISLALGHGHAHFYPPDYKKNQMPIVEFYASQLGPHFHSTGLGKILVFNTNSGILGLINPQKWQFLVPFGQPCNKIKTKLNTEKCAKSDAIRPNTNSIQYYVFTRQYGKLMALVLIVRELWAVYCTCNHIKYGVEVGMQYCNMCNTVFFSQYVSSHFTVTVLEHR